MADASHEKTGPSATIDIEGLRRFIRDRRFGDAGDLRAENISFGHSNEVHLLHFEGKSWALRRPPRGPLLPTAHDVLREYRVIKALQETPVPPEQRRAVSEKIVELLVALQSVDWRAVGLEGFGRPDGYIERQLRRWSGQLERTLPLTRPLPMMMKVQQWLAAHIPQAQPATIAHGDFKLDNVMWDATSREIKAIALFDWEMSTIGDPLADLGWMVTYWSDPEDNETRRSFVSSMDVAPGYHRRREMVELYERKSGRAMRDFAFYEIFSLFKLAIILEGSYSRYLSGQADDPMFATYDVRVPGIADVAWSLCEQAG